MSEKVKVKLRPRLTNTWYGYEVPGMI